MENQTKPKISASLSLSPMTHSYANSQAPKLNLAITSHHPVPITIYADDLSPSEVRQSSSTHCRIPPPSKVAVPLNEQLFHTLLPDTTLNLSAPFTRSRTSNGGEPLAKNNPDYTSDRSAKHGACGVDGLEPGHNYALSLASNSRVPWNIIRWWEYGAKEQVLHADGDGSKLNGRGVRFGPGPHEAIMVDSKSIGVVPFQCQE